MTHFSTANTLNQNKPRNKERWSGVERRRTANRRTYSMATLIYSLKSPRRFKGRRREDRRFPLMDRFESAIGFLAIGLVMLSLVDSAATLTLIAHGGTEENPFMAWVMSFGDTAFVAVKMLLTAIPAVLLVATGNLRVFNTIRVRSLLAAMVGLYAGLILYEIGLLSLALR